MDQNLFVDASRPRQKFQFIITLDAAQLRKDRGQVPLLLHGKYFWKNPSHSRLVCLLSK